MLMIPGWSCVQCRRNEGQPGSWGQETEGSCRSRRQCLTEGGFLMNLLPEDIACPGRLGGSSWHSHSCFLLWIYGLVFFWAPTEWCILIGEAQSLPLVFSEVIKRDMSPEKSVQGGMDMPTGKGRTWSMWLFDKGAKTEAEERWLLHGAGWGRCGRLRSSFTLHKNQFKAEPRPKYKTWNIETAGG